jgi:hypothetical protein
MLYGHGKSTLNGTGFRTTSAIFPGDTVATYDNSEANIRSTGSVVRVLAKSIIEFQGAKLVLYQGGIEVNTSRGMAARISDVTVAPQSLHRTKFEIHESDGALFISALEGNLAISDATGNSTLPAGHQITRKKRKGAPPAATGAPISGRTAIIGAKAAAIGVALWKILSCSPVCPDGFTPSGQCK